MSLQNLIKLLVSQASFGESEEVLLVIPSSNQRPWKAPQPGEGYVVNAPLCPTCCVYLLRQEKTCVSTHSESCLWKGQCWALSGLSHRGLERVPQSFYTGAVAELTFKPRAARVSSTWTVAIYIRLSSQVAPRKTPLSSSAPMLWPCSPQG